MAARIGRLAVTMASAALAASLGASGASAATIDLFLQPTPADAFSAATPNLPRASKATVRERLARLNLDALAPAAPAAGGASAKPPKVRVSLFPGSAASFSPKGVETTFGGASVWRGVTDDGDAATLVLLDGKAAGRVTLKGRTYRISPVGGRLHRIAEVERNRLPRFGESPKPPAELLRRAAARPAAAPAEPKAGERTLVTVLFAYTEQAKQASQNIMLDALMSAELANDAYKASNVMIRLKTVGLQAVKNYDESVRSYEEVLSDLTAPAKPFEKVHKQRDKKGADFVALLREGGEACGLAWINNFEDAGWMPELAFSESTRDCIEFDVVAHELGHNMGLRHDRYVEDPADHDHYNYGFIDMKQAYRDVMSYPDRCYDKGFECKGINVFSNPEIKYGGRRFGVEQGKKGAADASRWLNENRVFYGGFRPDVPVGPAASAED